MKSKQGTGGFRNSKRGSPVIHYRKCTQWARLYAFYTGKSDLLKKRQIGVSPPPPLNRQWVTGIDIAYVLRTNFSDTTQV